MTPQRRKDHATQYAKKVDPARIAGDTLPLGTKKPDLAAGLFLDWQPRKDSNLRMPESESGALPLGDGAKCACNYCTFSLKNQANLVAMGGLEPPTPAL